MHENTKVTDVEIERNKSPNVEEIQNTDNEIHEIENEILAYGRGATTKDHLCECEHCGEIFTNSRSLWLHTKKEHKVKKRKNHSDLQESASKKVLLDDEISIDKEVGSENVTELPTATYLDLNKDKEPKKNKKMNKKQKAEMLKGKKSKSRKGKKATSAKNACSDGELAENAAASNDDTGPVGKDKTKKANKDLKNIESESKTRQIRKESVLTDTISDSGEMKMSKESVVKESEYFSAHSQVKILQLDFNQLNILR